MARSFVVEADGGSRGNPGPAGYGAVVLDATTGETLAEAAEFIGTATNNVAEYRGLIAGLRAAHALDPQASVRVRMDSKLVVEQMSGRWKIKHPDMRPLAAEAKSVFAPGRVTYEWIPRERNKHADRLANEAMDAGRRGRQWRAADSTAELGAGARPVGRAPAAGRRDATPEPEEAPPQPAPGAWATSADLGTPTTFVLLRHGETELTAQKRFSGSGGADPSLSAAGHRQAEAAAAALAARGTVQAVVSSPLRRCRETADAVAARLGLEVRVDEGLRETDFGAWEGLSFAEVRERYPDDLNAWLGSAKAAPTGSGESFASAARRIALSRDKLIARYAGRTVLLVTHVTPVKTLVRLALGAPPEALFRMDVSAASLSAVAYYGDGNASLRLLNDTGHLR
ncbi:bifunctional RNase H/acid phosphatase [Streptomyces meridianus]|uniref:Bifunctional RNase H/acid phosphatase n=1 Tax=Streptomyces meridianus TaxID=2938945 RepID=A0ABT0X9Z1_9ACTN|nr:bifunctional RNase H/acid phosphatase [Streptomyces meridianus]MCM2579336.1 bifunctional RNase H/acid phosphatase [Streptomyces meridianus]